MASVAQFWICYRPNITPNNLLETIFFEHATREGYVELVQACLEASVNPYLGDHFGIQASSANGHVAIVEILLAAGTDPTAQHNSAIRLASENGHVEVVQLLLRQPSIMIDSKWRFDYLQAFVRRSHPHPAVFELMRASLPQPFSNLFESSYLGIACPGTKPALDDTPEEWEAFGGALIPQNAVEEA